MTEPPLSLLERLRAQPDSGAWQRLVALYGPLIRRWLQQYAMQVPDVDDLSQEVLAVVVRELPAFRHDLRRGAFRRWLRTITVNRLRTFWRSRRSRPIAIGDCDFENALNQLEDPQSRLSLKWDREHDEFVIRRLLELIEPEFEPTTWKAFHGLTIEDRTTAEVAAELGITANAARIAKSRVMRRFRQEVEGLID